MPRIFPTGLAEALKRGTLETHSTLELTLPDSATGARTLYFATAPVTVGGVKHSPQLRDTSAMKQSLTRAADRVTVDLQNVDTVLGIELINASESFYGARVRFGRYWRDIGSGAIFHKYLLTGAVVGVDVNENTARLALVSDAYAALNVGAAQPVVRNCRWEVIGGYKGPQCGSTSDFLTCNYLLDHADGCSARHSGTNNRARFGGFAYIKSQSTIAGAAAAPIPASNQLVKLVSTDLATVTTPAQQQPFFALNSETFAVSNDSPNEQTVIVPKTAVRKLNVKLGYGADGSGVADATAAFEAAIAAANPGDTLYIHPGKYLITSQLVIDQRINIEGEGASSVIYLDLDTSTDGIVIDGTTGAGVFTDNVSYKNFAVLGGASACRNAVVFRHVTHADVSNVHVAAGTASSGYGVVIEGCLISQWQLTVNAAMNYPYTATSPENGILVKGSDTLPSNANLFIYPAIVLANTSGESFFIDGSTGTPGTTNNWIIGGNIEGGGLNGLHLKNNNYFNVQSIHLENTSGAGDFNRVRAIIENCTHGYIGPGVGFTGLQLINTSDTTVDGIVADDVIIDEDCERIRIGRVQYNVTGLGGFHDSGVNTTYMGDLQVPGVTSSFLTGVGATASQVNLIRNGGAEFWNGGTCIDWSTESAGLTKTGTGLGDTRKLFGDYAVKTTTGTQYIFVSLRSPEIEMVAGRTITASVWVYVPSGQGTPPELSLELWIDGGAGVLGGQATDVEDEWVQLSTTFYVPGSATALQVTVHNSAAAGAGYFYLDGVSAVFGRTAPYAEATRLPHALGFTLNNGTYKTNFRPSSSQAAEINYTLPADDGSSGQALTTDGSGGLSWGTVATLSGSTNYYPFFNSGSTITTSGSLLQNFSGSLIVGGHVLFTDNTHDIGVSSDNRPRNVYVATAVTAPTYYVGGGGPRLAGGSADPEGAETAEPGSIYLRTNGTWYKKDSGSGPTGWALQGGSGASTALSNLASVAINTTLVSDTNNTDDLGTSAINWKDLYLAGTFFLAPRSDPGSPTNSDFWRSSTRNAISARISGQTEDLSTTMWRSSAQSSFDTTSAATSVIADTGVGTKTIAADRLVAGTQIRITAGGLFGTKASSAGTLTMRVRTGGTTMVTATFTLPDGLVDQAWSLEAVGALNTTGSSGVIYWRLTWLITDSSGVVYMPNVTTNSTTINTTTSRALDVTAQFSASDADNYFQTDNAMIEVLA